MKFAILLIPVGLLAQRPDPSTRVVTGTHNAGGAVKTIPNRIAGSAPSGACVTAGETAVYNATQYVCHTSTLIWTAISGGSGTPGGSSGQIQVNSSGAFAGYPLSTDGASTSTTEVASPKQVQDAIDLKTIPVVVGTDNNKTMMVDNNGYAALRLMTLMPPITFDNGASDITAAFSCQAREVITASVFKGVHLVSYDSTTHGGVTGSATVQVWRSSNSGDLSSTSLGTVTLSGAQQVTDNSLSGVNVGVNATLLFCITSASGVKKLTVSPHLYAQ